jgi:hypothetical protein
MWDKFKINNLTEYAKLYCEIDTLLLAEIFQKFRKTMLKFGGLDPAHYISLPGFGWDIMLKTTKCVIGLPKDVDQIHFIEKGIRGGLSFINTRYKSVKNSTEKSDPSIRYIDANVRSIFPFIFKHTHTHTHTNTPCVSSNVGNLFSLRYKYIRKKIYIIFIFFRTCMD